jgi:hypothetical protein
MVLQSPKKSGKRVDDKAGALRGGGGKTDWRMWPGGPPQRAGGIGFGKDASETWGFYDSVEQVDALLAYLNPQV